MRFFSLLAISAFFCGHSSFAQDIKPGRIETFQFTQSKIFPGTVREVTVFIPAQYDASKPACFYLKTDGYTRVMWTPMKGVTRT
jgi:hypothetical protein